MQKPDFLICAPLHMVFMSHGVYTLVQLARTIEQHGRRAFMCTYQYVNGREVILNIDFDTYKPANDGEKQYVDVINRARREFGIKMMGDFSPRRIDECYVVYPEAMRFNVLNAKRVVRYFLNKDTLVPGMQVNVGANDFILSYSKTMHPNPQHICLYVGHDFGLFNSKDTLPAQHRRLDITYLGKGAGYGLNNIVPGTLEITRTWPTTKEQLAILLRNCRIFYTGDACSKINIEALSCGAIPAFIYNGPWTDEEIDGSEFGVVPRLRANMKAGENFYADFEVARSAFFGRIQSYIDGWDDSVGQMIDKVEAHFANR